jgi:putative endopeptidase
MTTGTSNSLDLTNVLSDVRPQDDLFRHVNGVWLRDAEIPADRARFGAFDELRMESEDRVRKIIDECAASAATPGSNARKIGDVYRSFMDEKRIEELGVSPIAKELSEAQSISSIDELAAFLGAQWTRGMSGIFGSFIYADFKDSTTHIAYVSQSGISLPDESYYREAEHESVRTAFIAHMTKMFELAGIADAGGHAKRVMELETQIASYHWDRVKLREAELNYNKMSFAELQDLSGTFNWELWLEKSQIPSGAFDTLIVRQPPFFEGLSTLMSNFNAAAWQSWLMWNIISEAASYLSSAFVEENFDFFGRTLSGTPEMKERWRRGGSLVEGFLGEAIGELYVEKYFPPAAKQRMLQLVDNLMVAYKQSITDLDWMTEETKEKALVKLSKFVPMIGYPDKWRDYSALEIKADDLIGNLHALAKFELDYMLAKIGKSVDRDEWGMTPQTVNAYYNPVMNRIVFPAGILQAPFFDLEADDATNYGGIGAVIGHEVGHGFDDQGSKYDGDGNINNWWSEKDLSEFENRTKSLIDQYDVLRPEAAPDVHVNGALTIGENIGDLGGLTIAYKAYKIALEGKKSEVLSGLSGEQRLFFNWARVWRGKSRPDEARRLITIDPHSPAEFRCNQIVKNLDEFCDAFGVVEGDELFMPKEERVRIW